MANQGPQLYGGTQCVVKYVSGEVQHGVLNVVMEHNNAIHHSIDRYSVFESCFHGTVQLGTTQYSTRTRSHAHAWINTLRDAFVCWSYARLLLYKPLNFQFPPVGQVFVRNPKLSMEKKKNEVVKNWVQI